MHLMHIQPNLACYPHQLPLMLLVIKTYPRQIFELSNDHGPLAQTLQLPLITLEAVSLFLTLMAGFLFLAPMAGSLFLAPMAGSPFLGLAPLTLCLLALRSI